jgi:hypothetical protein
MRRRCAIVSSASTGARSTSSREHRYRHLAIVGDLNSTGNRYAKPRLVRPAGATLGWAEISLLAFRLARNTGFARYSSFLLGFAPSRVAVAFVALERPQPFGRTAVSLRG